LPKKEIVENQDQLIEKIKMFDIMYDLAILEGIKYQNITSADYNNLNIFIKYKIDSCTKSKSNVYYASNYEEYKIFDEIVKRIDDQKQQWIHYN
jgi:hypothetical protein